MGSSLWFLVDPHELLQDQQTLVRRAPPNVPFPLCSCRKASLILSQLEELSPWCKGLLQEPKIGLRRMSLKFLSCRYTDTKVFGISWLGMGPDVHKACDLQTLTVMYNDYGEPKEL